MDENLQLHHLELWSSWSREHHQVVDQLTRGVHARDDIANDGHLASVGRMAQHENLHGAPHPSKRVANLVCNDGRHLGDTTEDRLLGELLFGRLPGRDVDPDGDVFGSRRATPAHSRLSSTSP
jgi:hypothetical protein